MRRLLGTLVLCSTIFSAAVVLAQDKPAPRAAPDTSILEPAQWKRLDESVQKGLKWLATQQQEDGSFKSPKLGQPAVTSLCLMAFMAQGESPAGGEYQQPVSYTHLTLPTILLV